MWGEGEEPRLKVQKWAKTRHLWLPASQPASQPSSHRILIHSFRTSLCRRSDCKLTRITNDGEPSEQKHRSFLEKCGSIFSRKFKIGCDINSSNSGCTLFFFSIYRLFFNGRIVSTMPKADNFSRGPFNAAGLLTHPDESTSHRLFPPSLYPHQMSTGKKKIKIDRAIDLHGNFLMRSQKALQLTSPWQSLCHDLGYRS